ncbi:MAG: glycosyltransferase [Myxococcota bacterium]
MSTFNLPPSTGRGLPPDEDPALFARSLALLGAAMPGFLQRPPGAAESPRESLELGAPAPPDPTGAAPVSMEVGSAARGATVAPPWRTLHFIWVGDESKCPHHCIQSWREKNPGWSFRLWRNEEYRAESWRLKSQMEEMWPTQLCGVADMMRYEILYRHGGFFIDADSICLRPLDDWLFQHDSFACWENERLRPGLIANGYMFFRHPGDELLRVMIEALETQRGIGQKQAWVTCGPNLLTMAWKKLPRHPMTVLPSHYFIPEHYEGLRYAGDGPVYAKQLWASTKGYDTVFELSSPEDDNSMRS